MASCWKKKMALPDWVESIGCLDGYCSSSDEMDSGILNDIGQIGQIRSSIPIGSNDVESGLPQKGILKRFKAMGRRCCKHHFSRSRKGKKMTMQTSEKLAERLEQPVAGTSQATAQKAVLPGHDQDALSHATLLEGSKEWKIQENMWYKENSHFNDYNSGKSISHLSLKCTSNDEVLSFYLDSEKDDDDTFSLLLKDPKSKLLENKASVQPSSSSRMPMDPQKPNEANLYSRTVTVTVKSNMGATTSDVKQSPLVESSAEKFTFPLDYNNEGATTSSGKKQQAQRLDDYKSFTLPGTANEFSEDDDKLIFQKKNAVGTGHDTPIRMKLKVKDPDTNPNPDPDLDQESHLDLKLKKRVGSARRVVTKRSNEVCESQMHSPLDCQTVCTQHQLANDELSARITSSMKGMRSPTLEEPLEGVNEGSKKGKKDQGQSGKDSKPPPQ